MERLKPPKGLAALFGKRKPSPVSNTQVEKESPNLSRKMSYETAYLYCLGKRERQEDAYVFVNESDVVQMDSQGMLAVVADGMGGMYGGKEASTAAIDTMKRDFEAMDRSSNIAKQLVGSVCHANDAVYGMLQGRGGSTLISCIFFNEKLYYAGVGDSFLYLMRKGQLIRLNREQNVKHRIFLEAIERGCVDPSVADDNREQTAVTRYLGMNSLSDVDFFRKPLKLLKDDVILLCSDGVAGMMSEGTIIKCLSCGNAAASCAALDQAVVSMNNPYQDNYTALVIRCDK